MPLNENPRNFQAFHHRRKDGVCVLEAFHTFKYYRIGWARSRALFLQRTKLGEINQFRYLDACTLPDGRVSDEVFPNIQKACLVLFNS